MKREGTKMNQLMASDIKMTSLDIAEVTGKRHQHVMRDIRIEIETLGEEISQSIFGQSTYTNERGREYDCYTFGRKGAMQLALKYDAKTRFRVIERIEELEKLNQPQLNVTVDKSDELEVKRQSAEARLKNANARMAKVELEKWKFQMEVARVFDDVLDPDMKQLIASNLINETTGQNLLPAPETEKLYTCEEIALKLNLNSKSGNPHKQFVAAIIKSLIDSGDVGEHEMVRVLESKGNWTGDTVKYKQSVVGKVKVFVSDLSRDVSPVSLGGRNFNLDLRDLRGELP